MPPKPIGLGRGLDSLIPGANDFIRGLDARTTDRASAADSAATIPPAGFIEVAIGDVQPNPRQPRSEKGIAQSALDELAASIREHGIIQPLIVKRTEGKGAPFTLIAGERRWRASQMAGLKKVPVVIKDVANDQMLELALIENIQRHDLNALEEAQAYQQLMHELELTHEQVAGRVGKSRSAITNTMRLLELPDKGQQLLIDGKISEGHARAVLGLKSAVDQAVALDAIVQNMLSVRQAEELVRRMNTPKPVVADAAEQKTANTKAYESKLRNALGTKVSLNRSAKGGKIVIEFYSDEEFDSIYQRIVQE
jgi:ParB family chromosome partitioning protein